MKLVKPAGDSPQILSLSYEESLLREKELAFVDQITLSSALLKNKEFIQYIQQTQRSVYCLDWSDLLCEEKSWNLFKPDAIAIKASLKECTNDDAFMALWRPRIEQLKNRNFNLWFSFDIDSDDLTYLGLVITKLRSLGIKKFHLSTQNQPHAQKIAALKNCFSFLRLKNLFDLEIYFDFSSPHREAWLLHTECSYSSLRYVQIDLSNKCTHSCEFCGTYSNAVMGITKNSGNNNFALSELLKKQTSFERAIEIIDSLPDSVYTIQFGGMGDPMTHPRSVDIFEKARKRGFSVEILSNMEYLEDESIERLHKLGGKHLFDFNFIANISGITEETYLKTRPRQSPATYKKVMNNLKKISELRKASDGAGIHFTMMCVVTNSNYHELELYAKKSVELGASSIYFKPLSIHDQSVIPLRIDSANKEYPKILKRALAVADEAKLPVLERDLIEKIVEGVQ